MYETTSQIGLYFSRDQVRNSRYLSYTFINTFYFIKPYKTRLSVFEYPNTQNSAYGPKSRLLPECTSSYLFLSPVHQYIPLPCNSFLGLGRLTSKRWEQTWGVNGKRFLFSETTYPLLSGSHPITYFLVMLGTSLITKHYSFRFKTFSTIFLNKIYYTYILPTQMSRYFYTSQTAASLAKIYDYYVLTERMKNYS